MALTDTPDDREHVESTVSAATNFTIVPNGFLRADVTPRARDTYVLVRSYLREGHATFPKIETVAENFGRSESYVKRGIKELTDKGFLVVSKRIYRGGFLRVNQYHFPDVANDGTPLPPRPSGRVRSDTPGTVTYVTPPGGSDLTPPLEEEKYEEEKYEPSGGAAAHGAGADEDDMSTPAADALTDLTPVAADVLDGEVLDAELVDDDKPGTNGLLGEWIAHRQALTGARPTGRVIGHLARELKALFDEGQPAADVAAGLKLWDSKGLHPSCLASCVDEARGPVPKSRRQQANDAIFDAAARRAGEPNPMMTGAEHATARRTGPSWREAQALAAERTATLRRAEIDACDLCDDDGRRRGMPCTHDPEQDTRNGSRIADIRRTLRERNSA